MVVEELLRIPAGGVSLEGMMTVPEHASGLVIFAHGAGSSRLSPRNTYVARILQGSGLGTLLFDLLTQEEDLIYRNRFDIDLISRRMAEATMWVAESTRDRALELGYFGASTGSAAALKASVEVGVEIRAIVSRGGRPDLVMDILPEVRSPTLFIVGGNDPLVAEAAVDIEEQVQRLDRVVNDVLDFSKLEAGKLETREEEFDLREFLDEIFAFGAARASINGLEFRGTVSHSAPSC